MSGDKLKIDNKQMQMQVENITDAVKTYQSFATNPFEEEIGCLERMNTDFTVELNTMLGDLNDGNSKQIEALEEIKGLTKEVLNQFEEIDQNAAEQMGGIQRGE